MNKCDWPPGLVSRACPLPGDTRVCEAYLKDLPGLWEATLARRGMHSGSTLASQARLRVPRAPYVGRDRVGGRRMNKCDWPPGLVSRACPLPGDTRVCEAYLKDLPGLWEATLARRGMHSGSTLASQARLRVPRAPYVGRDRVGGRRMNKCDWPPGLVSRACPLPGDTRVCEAYLKDLPGLWEATLARRGMHSGSTLASQARLRVPRAPYVGRDRVGGRRMNKCDWPPGLVSRACPLPGDTRVCEAYLKDLPGLWEATLARRGMHSGSTLASQARLRVPRAPYVGRDRVGGRRMNKCDWPPGLVSRACPLPGDTRVCGAYLKDFLACRRRRWRVAACTRGRRASRKLDFASPEPPTWGGIGWGVEG